MTNQVLIWAAVPHNSDGVVFEIRIGRGSQRFYISRRVLEDVFDLEARASDATQLELFYQFQNRILIRASKKRSTAGLDTVALQATDFFRAGNKESSSNLHANERRSA